MFGLRPNSNQARICVLGFSANRVWLASRFLGSGDRLRRRADRLSTLTGTSEPARHVYLEEADRLGTLTETSEAAGHVYGYELSGSARLRERADWLGTLTGTSEPARNFSTLTGTS